MELKDTELAFICPQKWDNMTPCDNGRFCTICQKTVFDFTQKSKAEYDAFVQKHEGEVFGLIFH